MTVPVRTLAKGTHIRWPYGAQECEGYVIELHKPSGRWRISPWPDSDVAHWTLLPDAEVEVVK